MPPFQNGAFTSDPEVRAAYSEGAGIFRIVPGAVAVPSTTRALGELIRWAAARGSSLTPRGAGSGMTGGNLGDGILVDLTVLDGCPLTVDGQTLAAVTGAGVTLRALQMEAGRFGLRLPPDPSSGRFATVGGMVSTNAAGPTSVRSGSVRRWVEALHLISAEGQPLVLRRGTSPPEVPVVERFRREAEPVLRAAGGLIRDRFPRTRKNSSGYALDAWLESGDLLDLVIGSEGTLAFITAIEWRLEAIPRHRAGLRAGFRSLAEIGALVPELVALEPSAFEFLDATLLRFVERSGVPLPGAGAGGILLLEFEHDDAGDVEARVRAAAARLAPVCHPLDHAGGGRELERLWEIRHAASPRLATLGQERRSLQVIEDGCVPESRVAEYVAAVERAAERQGIEVVMFGHLGCGNVHVNLLPDVSRPGWESRVRAVFEEVSSRTIELGGSLSGEHGDGRLRTPILAARYGTEVMELFRKVKHAFDPAGRLNPGVKIPLPGQPVLGPLKVGSGAAPIPPDLERRLRAIEQTAGYSLSRLELGTLPWP